MIRGAAGAVLGLILVLGLVGLLVGLRGVGGLAPGDWTAGPRIIRAVLDAVLGLALVLTLFGLLVALMFVAISMASVAWHLGAG